ncbi:MAG: DUF4340 domain-containing protein [Clostridia bacterium]|nr:DUF4340 domain-containing protein [Clostridia bacterium]
MKTRKKNPLIPLLALVLVLAVLLIGYKALSAANERKAAAEALAAQESDTSVTVAEYDLSTMTALEFQPSGGESLRFVVVNGAWQYAADPAFPLNATTIAQMATAIASITADRTVDEGAPADYGLDDPSCVITAEYGAEKHTYKTGDYNSFSGSYYLMADGAVYLVSQNLASTFSKSLDSLLVRDTIPTSEWASREYVNGVTVRDGSTERTVTDADEVEEILTALGKVSLYTCTDYAASEDEKAACGLDGSRSVTVNYRKAVSTEDSEGNTTATNYLDTSYTLLFGDETESGVTCSPMTSTMIYTVSADTASSLLSYAAGTDSEP